MSAKPLSALLAAAALTLPAWAAPAASAAPAAEYRHPVATGSADLAPALLDLIVCLIQLPPSASGDPSQGCNT
ncbi:hypothetical protein [Nocardia cyriacigeorgica]|uniref:Uncharacterized protein n=1 Tax=Nocardia cyriacigeorgica (strain GUH-2) TaxID=1127134 RepID=H6R5S2_NOCCG|nr:hypothetical protein [Nocardia cyriacigeorgica]BDT87051.1 hypothetical protein FMUAM8_28150 [Nocardia cyriacigeorgica]CCF63403.1 exported protein of unknown function [Nocardia cyriacigeorgica GUH-2]